MLSTAKERQLKIVNRLKVEQFMRIIDLVEFV
ncbi:DeoR/GlpR family DNA-binding transcription regulator, partial [Listeria monocytogenes]